MEKKKIKTQKKENNNGMNLKSDFRALSYHLKCAKTANGLTHFVMYGDVPKKEMTL